MADANSLLETSLNRSIVDTSTKLADAAQANHASQLNNFSRAAELLSKNIVEFDLAQGIAYSEGTTRMSPTSQGFHLGNTLSQVGSVVQHNQNFISQGFIQLQSQIAALQAQIASK